MYLGPQSSASVHHISFWFYNSVLFSILDGMNIFQYQCDNKFAIHLLKHSKTGQCAIVHSLYLYCPWGRNTVTILHLHYICYFYTVIYLSTLLIWQCYNTPYCSYSVNTLLQYTTQRSVEIWDCGWTGCKWGRKCMVYKLLAHNENDPKWRGTLKCNKLKCRYNFFIKDYSMIVGLHVHFRAVRGRSYI